MSTSTKSSWISTRIKRIDDTLKEIESYKDNVYKLEKMFHEGHVVRQRHHHVARDTKDTIELALNTIKEAQAILDEATPLNSFTSWVERLVSSGIQSKEFKDLELKMATNDNKVRTLAHTIENITAPQAANDSSRPSSNAFNYPIEKKIAFTEPYDEDLCDF
ncbi:hypothetical protein HG530_008163 [Fusarium avenaceum]|nr:hypothetical protein HG530_008163 [Fusarium avenaceum]